MLRRVSTWVASPPVVETRSVLRVCAVGVGMWLGDQAAAAKAAAAPALAAAAAAWARLCTRADRSWVYTRAVLTVRRAQLAASLGKGNAAISKVVCAKAAAARHRFKVVLKSCPVPAPVDTALAMGSFKIALPGGRRKPSEDEGDDDYGTSLDAEFGI